ncbi:MAG TPA: hypothetical protein VGV39_22965 [Mesorhizobium sp.]|jgi:hypothetical protein|uniref:hypothetical protein n=1 Tax=Mesorhizobium sp. TaxID=1871066 RepID=UPI002DDD4779|nr:hypothetical protein [Mesorhizobium sp.]HEV2505957.1 hypothetical protein [Mesorhizobium sp.]
MPIRQKLEDAAILLPDEVDLLTKVFAATSVQGETDADREKRASRIIANYQLGIRDETELAELSRRPLGR